MRSTLFIFTIYSAIAFAHDIAPSSGFGCPLAQLTAKAGRDVPPPVTIENESIDNDRLIIDRYKQTMGPGIVGEVGEVVVPHDGGYYIQVNTAPGGSPYKTVHVGPGPFDMKKVNVPMSAIATAVNQNSASKQAPYLFLSGDYSGVDGQVKRVQGEPYLTLSMRHHLETPSAWHGFYTKGHKEVALVPSRHKGETAVVEMVLEQTDSNALQLAKMTRKPVVAPRGKLEYWYSPREQKLFVGVHEQTSMTERMLPMNEAFIKAHPDGRIEKIENPLDYIGARSGVEVVWDTSNPKFRDGAVLQLGPNGEGPPSLSPRALLETLHEHNLIDYETYLNRLQELGEDDGANPMDD